MKSKLRRIIAPDSLIAAEFKFQRCGRSRDLHP
jgi:hypothetical protein